MRIPIPTRRSIPLVLLAVAAVIACMATGRAEAHEGPPFPILVDKPTANFVISVWADPDIGEATFYIVVESPEGGMPKEEPHVSLWVQPVSGRLEGAAYSAKRQALRKRMQFEVKPYFDERDLWTVAVRIAGSGGEPEELLLEVESTPPGLGRWDLAIYLFPFLLLGGLWAAALARRSRMRRLQKTAS
jgi:hypothetical protein